MKATAGAGYTLHDRDGKAVVTLTKKTYITDECYNKEKDFHKEETFVKNVF